MYERCRESKLHKLYNTINKSELTYQNATEIATHFNISAIEFNNKNGHTKKINGGLLLNLERARELDKNMTKIKNDFECVHVYRE
jgi:hypothetical protein